ncbi:site-specific integrase [Marixanthomonas sp. SCSIO 43207]|uniref:phage integrase SAM-like domain-containing protein n=1 Tax=Marixanthomonas sp. SCSIO 43207 TaxID=2779360 RepID=UPI001CA9D59F|nr:phage integrase SAM-like domain-containing protein [Marixanthomonas sp. SCSIO 43207]UAB82383.1 site-specific integrase [Marixanthomonas sp. SCSIO 43207]
MTVTPCFRKKKTQDSYGYLGVRVTLNRKSSIHNVGEKIHKKFWNRRKHKIRKSHPESVRLNKLLADKIKEIKELEETPCLSISDNNLISKSFLAYYHHQIINYDRSLSRDTVKSYRSAYLMLERYLKEINKEDLLLEQVNKRFISDLKNFLIDQKLALSSIHKYFKHIKTIYNRGVEAGLITNVTDPFKGLKIGVPVKSKQFLTINNIKDLIYADIPRESPDEITRMKFLVQFFGQGLRISDLFTIRYKNIMVDSSEAIIQFSQFKTKHPLTVFVSRDLLRYMCYFINPQKYYDFYYKRKYKFLLDGKEYSMTYNGHQSRHKFLFSKLDVGSKFYKMSVNFMENLNEKIYKEQLQLIKQKKQEDPSEFIVKGLNKHLYNDESFAPRKILNKKQKAKFETCKNYYVESLKSLDKYMQSGINIVGHTARHSFARHQLEIGTDSYLIRDLLGHKDIRTTEEYLRGFHKKIVKKSIKKSHYFVMLNLLNDFNID